LPRRALATRWCSLHCCCPTPPSWARAVGRCVPMPRTPMGFRRIIHDEIGQVRGPRSARSAISPFPGSQCAHQLGVHAHHLSREGENDIGLVAAPRRWVQLIVWPATCWGDRTHSEQTDRDSTR
jgi:hypothetical protein